MPTRRPDPPTCKGVRKDGSRCSATTLGPSGFCFAHDPTRVAERDAARRRGGQNSANVVRIAKLVPARLGATFDLLEEALGAVRRGELEPKTAQALAALASAMARVLTTGEAEQRQRDLAEQLRALEEQVRAQRGIA